MANEGTKINKRTQSVPNNRLKHSKQRPVSHENSAERIIGTKLDKTRRPIRIQSGHAKVIQRQKNKDNMDI